MNLLELVNRLNDLNCLYKKHNKKTRIYVINMANGRGTLVLGSEEQQYYGTYQCILVKDSDIHTISTIIRTLNIQECFEYGE